MVETYSKSSLATHVIFSLASSFSPSFFLFFFFSPLSILKQMTQNSINQKFVSY